MAKSKTELMADLKTKQTEKAALEAKIKGGDTTEATRKALKAADDAIVTISTELKNAVESKSTPASKAPEEKVEKPEEKVEKPSIKEGYKVKADEKHVFHVLVSKGNKFDPKTGEKLEGKESVRLMEPKAFAQFKQHAKVLGFQWEVIHEAEPRKKK